MKTRSVDGSERTSLTLWCSARAAGAAIVDPAASTLHANAAFLARLGLPDGPSAPLPVALAGPAAPGIMDAQDPAIPGPPWACDVTISADGGTPRPGMLMRLPHMEALVLAVSAGLEQSSLSRAIAGIDDDTFKRFIEHLPAGLVIHDRTGAVTAANALGAALLNHSLDALLERNAFDDSWYFFTAEGQPMPQSAFPAVQSLRQGRDLRDVVVGIGHDASHVQTWVLCNTLLIRDEQGAVSMAVVSFTDCTTLKNTQSALRQSEERLRLILLGTNDAPWDWDLASNAIYYSDRWWSMLGMRPGELPDDAQLWFRLVHPDDQACLMKTFESALAAGATYEVEFRLRHKAGHYVPVMSRGFVLRDEHGKAVRVSGTNSDLSERKKSEQRIHQLAYFDQLTGLPNRRQLMEHAQKALARALRHGHYGAILFLDLDNFKDLNDTLGHDVGDKMLTQFAGRLRLVLREPDLLARLGGDEFVVVAEELGTDAAAAAQEAELVASRLLGTSSQRYFLGKLEYAITPSIGVAMFDGGTGSIDALLKQADLAMYSAKAAGRGLVRFFDPAMQQAAERRSALESGLHDALAQSQFVLHCQPQFDAELRLVGGEMLLRWQHPELGLIGPGTFIEVAENCGLIQPIGSWVLAEACRALSSWRTDPVLGRLTFSINVSARQLHARDFVRHTLDIVGRMQVDPSRLCLELTESVLASDIDNTADKMHALCAHGYRFSIDDFGTGYSSLSYLRRFPLHVLKIDRSFVQDEGADAIVEAILALAPKLGLAVVAEGVENAAQFDKLRSKGCAFYQGFHLGRPMPLDGFRARFMAGARTSPSGSGGIEPA